MIFRSMKFTRHIRDPARRANENQVIELIDVIFILQQRMQRSQRFHQRVRGASFHLAVDQPADQQAAERHPQGGKQRHQ